MNHVSIDLHGALLALSSALDLVGIDETHHGKRVAAMAYQISLKLGWPMEERYSLLLTGLLHDCGVSRVREHRGITETLEWEGAEAHCLRGAEYLSTCPPLAHLAPEVRYHHTRWEDLLKLPLDDRVRLRANLIYLADRVDVLQIPFLGSERVLLVRADIVSRIQSLAGSLFAPELVDAFAQAAQLDAFWLAMDADYLEEDLRGLGAHQPPVEMEFAEMKEIARLFSRVVDAKSPFTEEHSLRVAWVARRLAEDLGYAGDDLEEIEIAGLLHDLGKLRVSEDIIEKPGRLTPEERAIIHRHSYDTFRILQRVFKNTRIPAWAGLHHENLRGEGYPFRITGGELDMVTRIISVADIFQALAQHRPYRQGNSLKDILADLRGRVEEGELDHRVVEKLAQRAEEYYQLAVQ